VRRRPHPPFTTSSLQQEASRKLGFGASRTMRIAQKLYEGIEIDGHTQGLITYMRTDSVSVGPEAITSVRKAIGERFGDKYLPSAPNFYKNKVKNAQEAHEAIHPTDYSYSPDRVKKYLDADHHALYDLIWKRMMASQMSDAILDQMSVDIISLPSYAKARAVGSVIKFDGFLHMYQEGKDEKDEEDDEKRELPPLKENELLGLTKVDPAQHFTEPPPRYSEASLVKKLEELGIGRPSTYASIISVLQDRGYVLLSKRRFFPEERGRIVVGFLKLFFPVNRPLRVVIHFYLSSRNHNIFPHHQPLQNRLYNKIHFYLLMDN
jgi:DNA topoisomerase-1